MLESLEFEGSPLESMEDNFNDFIQEANRTKGVKNVKVTHLPIRVDTLFSKAFNFSNKMVELEIIDAKI